MEENLGKLLLIIFSVLLALFLTELIDKQHDKRETNELLDNIRAELTKNKAMEAEQYAYETQVLHLIDLL